MTQFLSMKSFQTFRAEQYFRRGIPNLILFFFGKQPPNNGHCPKTLALSNAYAQRVAFPAATLEIDIENWPGEQDNYYKQIFFLRNFRVQGATSHEPCAESVNQ